MKTAEYWTAQIALYGPSAVEKCREEQRECCRKALKEALTEFRYSQARGPRVAIKLERAIRNAGLPSGNNTPDNAVSEANVTEGEGE